MPSRKRLAAKARKAKARSSSCLSLHDTTQCRHGCEQVPTESTQHQFVREFERTLMKTVDSSNKKLKPLRQFHEIIERMEDSNNFQEIFDDKDKQLQLFPLFLNLGTNLLLNDNTQDSLSIIAVMAAVFCQHDFDEEKAFASNPSKKIVRDLREFSFVSDAIRYFRSMTPCQCLKKKHVRAKAQLKMGKCTYCKELKERKELYLCGACEVSTHSDKMIYL